MSHLGIDHNSIENRALDVLDAYGIKEPVVDVAKIAKGEGIEIKETIMPKGYESVAGFYDKNKKTIYIRSEDPAKRKLFSVAHELGHHFLGHKNYTVLFRVPKDNVAEYPAEESAANSFAAHLLMPTFMLRDYMSKYQLGKSDYEVLSDIFGVPVPAMRHTLEYLKQDA